MPYHHPLMKNDPVQIGDMTPEGEFVQPGFQGPKSQWRESRRQSWRQAYQPARHSLSFGTLIARLAAFAILIGFGVLLFWLAIFTLPVIFFGGVVLYGFYRFQMMRLRRRGGFNRRNPYIILRR